MDQWESFQYLQLGFYKALINGLVAVIVHVPLSVPLRIVPPNKN